MFPRDYGIRDSQLMSIYEFLAVKTRSIFLTGEVTFKEVTPWLPDLLIAMDRWSNEPIKLIIASPGGVVEAGLIIYDTMKSLKSPVYTIGRYCASIAAVLLAAGEPNHRYVLPHARIMLHLPRGVASGDTKDIELYSKEITKVKDILVDLLRDCGVKRMKKELLKDIDREYWLSAKEAIEYGIVDKLITPELNEELFCKDLKNPYDFKKKG